MRKTMFGLAVIGVALLTTAAHAQRQLLSSHETVAVFDGIKTHQCMGRTADCPWKCGDSGEYAEFSIKKYLKYKKPGQYGDSEQTKYSYQVSAYKGENNKQPAGDPKIRKVINGLKPGDYVLLSWNHDYVTGGGSSFPERPVVKLEGIAKDEAEKLIGKDPGEVTWDELKEIIKKGTVKQAGQTHSRRVSVTMEDGKTYHATEPAVDEIFRFLRETGKTPATMLTE